MRLDSKEQPHSETRTERSFGDVIFFCTHLCTRQIEYIDPFSKRQIRYSYLLTIARTDVHIEMAKKS